MKAGFQASKFVAEGISLRFRDGPPRRFLCEAINDVRLGKLAIVTQQGHAAGGG